MDPTHSFGSEVLLDEGELGVEFREFEECMGVRVDRGWW